MANFVKVCKTNDVQAGCGRSLDVNGKLVAVFNVDGNFHAINDTCAHRGGPLGEGELDGKTVKSCTMLSVQADGTEITTIEGIASNGELHPLQEAFRRHHGLQCGYCTPGMIMAGLGLIQDGSGMSDQEVRLGLEGNLCRCTGYQNIVEAIQDAASTMRQPADVQGGSA